MSYNTKEKQKEYAKEYRKRKPEKLASYRRNYAKSHPNWRKKYPRIKQKKIWMDKISERDGLKCKNCDSKERLTLEHKLPKCIGGKYSFENLEILCLKCNIKKYHKLVKKALDHFFKCDRIKNCKEQE